MRLWPGAGRLPSGACGRGGIGACRDGRPRLGRSVAVVVLRVRNKGGFLGTERGPAAVVGVFGVAQRLVPSWWERPRRGR